MQAQTFQQSFVAHLAGRHSAALSVSLHLVPGILAGMVYYLLAGPVTRMGLPSIVALMAAGVLIILPFELLLIACTGWGSVPRPLRFQDLIGYREPLRFWQYLVLAPALLVVTGLLFTLLNPVSNFLQGLFSWLPESAFLNMGMEGSYARSTLVWVTVFNALLVSLILPITEELYFRGFLMPRMPEAWQGWTPLASSFLFAVYHTWTPWMVVTRTVGLLPLFTLVRRTRNIYIGILVHCLANLIDVVTMIAFVSGMP